MINCGRTVAADSEPLRHGWDASGSVQERPWAGLEIVASVYLAKRGMPCAIRSTYHLSKEISLST